MQTTFTELAIPAVYRDAQRVLSQWIEARDGAVRREAFRARAAVARLDAVSRHRLARWLAWLAQAERRRGSGRLQQRLRQLDASLAALAHRTLATLPPLSPEGASDAPVTTPVSADTAPRMTSVSATR
ncbi:MAG TPA: hypothetical protein VFR91_09795 [Dyella sp.]|nr:hypothetical protein [Dyella sp.]